jgi:hypothetical protein
VLEDVYLDELTDEAWNEAHRLILPYYAEHGVEWIRSNDMYDRTRPIWELNAPDADVIRETHRKFGIPFDRVWSANVLNP